MSEPVHLPAYLSVRSASEAIATCTGLIEAEGDAILDGRQLRFADPFGLALLGATFHIIKQNGRAVRVVGLQADMSAYLKRMDVFKGVELVDCSPSAAQRQNRGDALVELTRLDLQRDVDAAAFRLAHTVVGHIPGVNPEELPDVMSGFTLFDRLVEPIQYALSELLENAMTHARGHGYPNASVWVASQYYPRKDTIRLGVVDNGCGFLASLRGHPELRHERHLDAILVALRPRISCNRDLRLNLDSVNQGVGLTTTCRIAEHAGGRLIIISGNGIHDTSGRSGLLANGATWQGVAIAMECRRNLLSTIRFRELLPPLDAKLFIRVRFE